MIEALNYPFDSEMIMRKRKSFLRELEAQSNPMVQKRIAVLGGSTTNDIVKILNLFLLNEHIQADFYESEYHRYWEDAIFSSEGLDTLQPEIVILHTSACNIDQFPSLSDSTIQVDALLNKTYHHFEEAWESLTKRFHCVIIQNNFELPAYRLLGNRDASDKRGKVSFIRRLNECFAAYARDHENFFINDINYLSACYGLDKWSDPSAWFLYKYCLSVQAIPDLSYNLARIIKSLCGRNKKALALDLDNTLWGGVIGDVGVEQIEIGQESAPAEAFLAFQSYLKEQAGLGILLTVCSKNEKGNALAGLNHPDSQLHPEDFLSIQANWNPKYLNIQKTAQDLNILSDSFVFVDDNPAEREIIHQWNPEIGIPQLTNPDQYIREVDRAGYFEVTTLSADDIARSQMYHENLQRKAAEASFLDYHAYLHSLDMHAEILPFNALNIPRITQLTNKSNQFNLTSRRYTQTEIEAIAADSQYISLYGRLTDKFGDNGVISVVICRIEGTIGKIDLWLMSCRVLKRDVEKAMLDELVSICRSYGVAVLQGSYFPTSKNKMVQFFYAEMGFHKLSETEAGHSVWEMTIDSYHSQNNVIEVNKHDTN